MKVVSGNVAVTSDGDDDCGATGWSITENTAAHSITPQINEGSEVKLLIERETRSISQGVQGTLDGNVELYIYTRL